MTGPERDENPVIPVIDRIDRYSLPKYAGMLVYERSSKRCFRWDAGCGRWEFFTGKAA